MKKFNDPIKEYLDDIASDFRGEPGRRVYRPWAKVVLWLMAALVLAVGGLGLLVSFGLVT